MRKYIGFLILILTYSSLGCKKFIEIPTPRNQLLSPQIFADSANATSAVLGIYISMMPNFTLQITNGGLSVYGGLLSDEIYRSSNNTAENEFFSNSISPTNSINAGLWRIAYQVIYNANACIEGLEKSQTLSASVKSNLVAEAKFSRAFVYFNLINIYGKVPLIVTTDYTQNKSVARVPVEAVYSKIVTDLNDAIASLPEGYATPGRFRPNRYTALALLAKVYLFQKNWEMAESVASRVISNRQYEIEPNLNDVFLSDSREAIWKLQVQYATVETWEGYFFNPATSATSRPTYPLTNHLLNAFEKDDKRAASGNWVSKKSVGGVDYFYPYKYKLRSPGTTSSEQFVVFRLAEMFLIRAEARTYLNNFTGAASDLNLIRSRAGLGNLATVSSSIQLLSAIQQERRVELFAEWANRWYDLKRWGITEDVLAPVKPDWSNSSILFPIPRTELDRNPQLTQNDGY